MAEVSGNDGAVVVSGSTRPTLLADESPPYLERLRLFGHSLSAACEECGKALAAAQSFDDRFLVLDVWLRTFDGEPLGLEPAKVIPNLVEVAQGSVETVEANALGSGCVATPLEAGTVDVDGPAAGLIVVVDDASATIAPAESPSDTSPPKKRPKADRAMPKLFAKYKRLKEALKLYEDRFHEDPFHTLIPKLLLSAAAFASVTHPATSSSSSSCRPAEVDASENQNTTKNKPSNAVGASDLKCSETAEGASREPTRSRCVRLRSGEACSLLANIALLNVRGFVDLQKLYLSSGRAAPQKLLCLLTYFRRALNRSASFNDSSLDTESILEFMRANIDEGCRLPCLGPSRAECEAVQKLKLDEARKAAEAEAEAQKAAEAEAEAQKAAEADAEASRAIDVERAVAEDDVTHADTTQKATTERDANLLSGEKLEVAIPSLEILPTSVSAACELAVPSTEASITSGSGAPCSEAIVVRATKMIATADYKTPSTNKDQVSTVEDLGPPLVAAGVRFLPDFFSALKSGAQGCPRAAILVLSGRTMFGSISEVKTPPEEVPLWELPELLCVKTLLGDQALNHDEVFVVRGLQHICRVSTDGPLLTLMEEVEPHSHTGTIDVAAVDLSRQLDDKRFAAETLQHDGSKWAMAFRLLRLRSVVVAHPPLLGVDRHLAFLLQVISASYATRECEGDAGKLEFDYVLSDDYATGTCRAEDGEAATGLSPQQAKEAKHFEALFGRMCGSGWRAREALALLALFPFGRAMEGEKFHAYWTRRLRDKSEACGRPSRVELEQVAQRQVELWPLSSLGVEQQKVAPPKREAPPQPREPNATSETHDDRKEGAGNWEAKTNSSWHQSQSSWKKSRSRSYHRGQSRDRRAVGRRSRSGRRGNDRRSGYSSKTYHRDHEKSERGDHYYERERRNFGGGRRGSWSPRR